MKVSASPFEPPASTRGAVDANASDDAGPTASAAPVEEAAATAQIRPELDSATRESLSRLSTLIRSQMKATEAAGEASKVELLKHEEEEHHREVLVERALKLATTSGEDETVLRERVTGENYPAVERVEKRLREENRKRGVQIYTRQKTQDSVQQILAALDDWKPPSDDFGEDAA